jgi:hypothetical protein
VVVLADEDDRQVPELGEVEGLRHLALVGSTVAVQREVHATVALVLVGKGDTRPQRNLNKKSGTIHFKKEANTLFLKEPAQDMTGCKKSWTIVFKK